MSNDSPQGTEASVETICEKLFLDFHTFADAGRPTRGGQLFTDDAVFEMGGDRHVGKDAISRFLKSRETDTSRRTRHLASNFRVTVDSEVSAHASASLAVYAIRDGGSVAFEGIVDCEVEFALLPDRGWLMSSRRHSRFA
jgi:hypothetical protein